MGKLFRFSRHRFAIAGRNLLENFLAVGCIILMGSKFVFAGLIGCMSY